MSFIEISNVSKIFERRGQTVEALGGLSLEAEFREFVCLLGVSGCGKSTLLQILAGHETMTGGSITIEGELLTGPTPR